MKLEAAQNYVRQHRALLSEQFGDANLTIAPEDLEPANFHERFDKLVDRFYDLPLSEKARADQYYATFNIESSPNAGENDAIVFSSSLFLGSGARNVSITLYDPVETPAYQRLADLNKLWSEKVWAKEYQQGRYSEENAIRLFRVEQLMDVVEEVVAIRGLQRVPRLFPVEETIA